MPLSTVQRDPENASRLILTVDPDIFDDDVITLSYQSDAVLATDGTLLEDFSDLAVKNNLPVHFAVPTKIEAENFAFVQGLEVENTTDVGGGQNVGYTSAGDYLEYRIRVPEDGDYPLQVRIACNSAAGIIDVEQRTFAGDLLNSVRVNIPVTGGWQTWQTVVSKMKLTAGRGILRVKIVQPEFNINWFRFLQADVVSGIEDDRNGVLTLYPNPTDQYITLEVPENIQYQEKTLTIQSINGMTVQSKALSGKEALTVISIRDLPSGMYVVELKGQKKTWRGKFTKIN